MQNGDVISSEEFVRKQAEELLKNNYIDKSYYDEFEVKRGLRNADGTGVMAGLTRIGSVKGYYLEDGE